MTTKTHTTTQGFIFRYPIQAEATVNQNVIEATAALADELYVTGLTARTKPHITISHASRQIEMHLQVDVTKDHKEALQAIPTAAFYKVQCPHCDALIVGIGETDTTNANN